MSDERAREVIYAQHLNRLRVKRSIEFLNSCGSKGENATLDDWVPDHAAVQQLNVWTDQDLGALAEAGLVVREADDYDACDAPSGYHDEGAPMNCTLRQGHDGNHRGEVGDWGKGTIPAEVEAEPDLAVRLRADANDFAMLFGDDDRKTLDLRAAADLIDGGTT